ncbi:hypothetical protein HZA33_05675, partial [Candidatus Pacearchaeota archaeon]|nr:hypothetical protein [Candidatus Pacearchaeota archaeon]
MKNKRGMYYTIATVFILAIFLLSFHYEKKLTEESIATRIRTMNSFISSAERDTSRALYITGFRTLLAIQNNISKGLFIGNATLTFQQAVINGTFDGKSSEFLQSSAFSDWVNTIKAKGSEMNIFVNITNLEIKLYQESPWSITLEADFNLFANDSNGLAYWNKQEAIKSEINIEGFEDPLYTIYTSGKLPNIVNRTIYEGTYAAGTDVSNLTVHALNSWYAANSNAPSYLMRLEGRLGSSPYGIESMINLVNLGKEGLPVYERSVIDYIYFSGQITSNYRIAGMPTWYRLDSEHLAKYQVTGLA